MSKRTLEAFFSPTNKRVKTDIQSVSQKGSPPPRPNANGTAGAGTVPSARRELPFQYRTGHETYPFPIADLPPIVIQELDELLLTASGKEIKDQPHLDLLYFQPLMPRATADELFRFLRASLPFYRVDYSINRYGKSFDVKTPRYTTVFGLDETSRFLTTTTPSKDNPGIIEMSTRIVEASNTAKDVAPGKYKSCTVSPRPIPPCLATLKSLTEALTNDSYNFVLVNYYSTGQDSISFHSDDERFLGTNPVIASFSLGARRDFLMKHKPPGAAPGNGNKGNSKSGTGNPEKAYPGTTQIKFSLGSGDMILMRGDTQRNWLHSIPKRAGQNTEADRGRINITMRKAMVPSGTENYCISSPKSLCWPSPGPGPAFPGTSLLTVADRYNVGTGPMYRWSEEKSDLVVCE